MPFLKRLDAVLDAPYQFLLSIGKSKPNKKIDLQQLLITAESALETERNISEESDD